MALSGSAVSERIVLFRHGPVTFGASVIGTAVRDCIGYVAFVALRIV